MKARSKTEVSNWGKIPTTEAEREREQSSLGVEREVAFLGVDREASWSLETERERTKV
jgi:hypothetical protein